MDMPKNSPEVRLRNEIDKNLKRVYEETLSEDIPDRFKVLLEQLRNAPPKGDQDPSGERQ